MMRLIGLVVAGVVAGFVASVASGQSGVRTDDAAARRLHAPAATDRFTFAVFGDRAPGAAAGLDVLARAVETVNDLGVRFVVTTGNMVQGDADREAWAERVSAYQGVMSGLSMPWYPAAGPLDTAIRSRPASESLESYRRQFGPLYYSFGSEWAHMVVLSSGLLAPGSEGRAAQLRWLTEDLRSTDAEQVFVVVHEPMWREGSAWDAVHEILRADGRPTRVISGGTRYAREDGQRHNVRYGSVAMTGAFASGTHGYASEHSVTLVGVTRRGHEVTVVPYDATTAGDMFSAVDAEAIAALTRSGWASVEGFFQAGEEAGDGAAVEVVLENPAEKRFAYDVQVQAPAGWVLSRDRVSGMIEPGQTLRLPISAEAPGLDGVRPEVEVVVTAWYPVGPGREQSVIRRLPVTVRPRGAEEAAGATPGSNGVLVLGGGGAVRVDLGERPWRLTAECWVRGDRATGNAAVMSRFADGRGFGLVWSRPGGVLPAGVVGTDSGPVRASAGLPLEWGEWHHVALTYDGRSAVLYVDGEEVGRSEDAGELVYPDAPLYIGAEPNTRGDPVSYFVGMIDEVRVSSVVRYEGRFTPGRVFETDEHTLLLMHFDTPLLGAFPDDSGRGNHGWGVGRAVIEREDR